MNIKKIFSVILIAFLVIIISFVFYNKKYTDEQNKIKTEQTDGIRYITINGTPISVEVADTLPAEARGLGGRTSLAENHGMLFVFDYPSRHDFWMKDMKFSIDMIWFDENLQVIYVKKNATPESYPNSFGPAQNSKYVLEVVSGFVDQHNIKIGDSASFNL